MCDKYWLSTFILHREYSSGHYFYQNFISRYVKEPDINDKVKSSPNPVVISFEELRMRERGLRSDCPFYVGTQYNQP